MLYHRGYVGVLHPDIGPFRLYYFTSYGIPGIYSPEQEFPKSRNQKAIGSLGPRGIALPKDGAMTDARCVFDVR